MRGEQPLPAGSPSLHPSLSPLSHPILTPRTPFPPQDLRGQIDVKDIAIQHAAEARDAAILRAETLERDLASLKHALEDNDKETAKERMRLVKALSDAESSTHETLEQLREKADRADKYEARAHASERTCVTLRLAVSSLEEAKLQLIGALDGSQQEIADERKRTSIERNLLRQYANETEQRIPVVHSKAEANAREAERVEASLTEMLTASETAAAAAADHHDMTSAQLRGHIQELEEAVIEQQASHERERAESDAAHEAAIEELNARLAAETRKSELLTHQLNALAEAAQQIKSERASAVVALSATRARLDEADLGLSAATIAAAAAAACEAAHQEDLETLRVTVKGLSDQLGWLEACARDAASDARPLLASRDAVPIIDADTAFRDERTRWMSGVSELHTTVEQTVDAFAWLVAELQDQLAASPAAGAAAAPAADLHEDLAAQIRAAVNGLPSTFAPVATFERGRVTLVEAMKAQAQLATQSAAHLISAHTDAEAVATLQGKQLKAQHAAAISSMLSAHATAVAALGAELEVAEERDAESSALAWRHVGGLAVHKNELLAIEESLQEESDGRAAAERQVSNANEFLDAARKTESDLRSEIGDLRSQLAGAREREEALETQR